jgi:hypothetical protein
VFAAQECKKIFGRLDFGRALRVRLAIDPASTNPERGVIMKRYTAIIFVVLGLFVAGVASGAQKSKPVYEYDICVEEDSGGAPVWFRLSSETGAYVFESCDDGFTLAGYASLTKSDDFMVCDWSNGEYEGWFEIRGDSAVGIVYDLEEKENVYKVSDSSFKDNACSCGK